MRIDRRSLLKGAAGLGLAGALGCAGAPRRPSLIAEENAKPGTDDWARLHSWNLPTLRNPMIEGYCSRTSVRSGEPLSVMVSTKGDIPIGIEVYRLGYYGGKGGRLMRTFEGLRAGPQPLPPVGGERLRECRWEPTLTFRIPDDWPSGVYLGKLCQRTNIGVQSYVIFIVRDDRPCDFLFQCSDTTWAAYNRWPDKDSLYDDGKQEWYTGPGVAVSFDRPYAKYRQIFDAPLSQGSGEFLLWEFPLAYWMEQQGYDVSYISNLDTHVEAPLRAKAFLSVGHDEYWTRPMFDHAMAAVNAGVHMAFFSGNSVDGLISLNGRSFSRVGKFGVFDHELKKFEKPWKEHGPNPATLMGARSTFPYNGTADWTCVNERHWLFDGTGMKNGDSIRGLVGWEHHGLPAAIPGLEILARGPVFSGGKPQNVEYTATMHPGPKGNLVFNAATIWWSDGLSAPPGYLRPSAHGGTPPGPDPRVQRMTSNLFRRFLA